jgi:hypothetical protein
MARGGRREGAGRPRLHPLVLSYRDIREAVRLELEAQRLHPAASDAGSDPAISRQLAMIEQQLKALARETEREPLLRRLVSIERHLGLVEQPKTPVLSRRRPLE